MATLLENRKAHFDYEILESFEAGVELLGTEVKSVRAGRGDLAGSYVSVLNGEAWLQGANILPFQEKNAPKGFEPRHRRRLLLNKKELWKLATAADTKGLTIIVLSLYNNKNKIKANIAIARGKKQFDKRRTTMKRETERDMRRVMSLRRK
jgi:SsrA-binding protein